MSNSLSQPFLSLDSASISPVSALAHSLSLPLSLFLSLFSSLLLTLSRRLFCTSQLGTPAHDSSQAWLINRQPGIVKQHSWLSWGECVYNKASSVIGGSFYQPLSRFFFSITSQERLGQLEHHLWNSCCMCVCLCRRVFTCWPISLRQCASLLCVQV